MKGTPIKTLKLVIAALCLVIAGLLFWWNQGDPVSADAPETKTAWMCAACDHIAELTAAEVSAAETRDGGIPLTCDACLEKRLYRVAVCPVCGAYFFGKEVPGSLGRCPVCFPPKSGEIIDEPLPTEDEEGRPILPSV